MHGEAVHTYYHARRNSVRVTGIICEFNPFHDGHKYLIEQAKELTGSDYTVCLMSGDFVQRGEPAALDKYTRTKQALEGGADLVLELPVRYALSSAGDFAAGGVCALSALGFVTDLCFGSEWGEIRLLEKTAQVLHQDQDALADAIRKKQKTGVSFAAAREQVLSQQYDLSPSLLSQPNNTLGVEYCLAILNQDSPLQPHTIKRQGAGYHEQTLSEIFPSATALRQNMAAENVPHLTLDDFSDMIGASLLKSRDLTRYKDISPDLAGRIHRELSTYHQASDLVARCQTRIFTESRVRRCLLQCLLDLTPEINVSIPYLRLLGMKKKASHLLKQVTDCRIITRLAADEKLLTEDVLALLRQDILASDLYRMIWNRKYGSMKRNEYQHSPLLQV